jgi:uroporphyrinogen decarboxylase
MTRRELIRAIIARQEAPPRCGFWLGKPHDDTWAILHRRFGTFTEQELRRKAGDDVAWICPQFYADAYQDGSGRELFDAGLDREKHGSLGPLAHATTLADVDAYPWPDPDFLNFDSCLRDLRDAGDVYRMSGFWTCYWHNACDLFGMETYLMNMISAPAIVHAVTDRICQFYYEANERFFTAAKGLVDGFFFGNDLGSQRGLIISPAQFEEFVFPWMKRFADQGKRHGLQVIVHSCGSIYPLIPRMIEAGVDCLHPLQALARDMNAEQLARSFKGNLTFLGGIDAQQVMTHGTPGEVEAEVRRVQGILGPWLIVSPSHEAILPNVPAENVEALSRAGAAREDSRSSKPA